MIILAIIIIILLLIILYFSINVFIENFTNVYDNIDAFIYINLENREDRKKDILSEFKKLNVPEEKIRKISGVFVPKNGHKGNVQSFILALELAKINKWKTVMICEDDMEIIVPYDEFNNKINSLLNILKEKNIKWDCIMLGQANGTKTKIDIYDMPNINKITNATTKTCIIVPEHFYDILLNNFKSSNDLMMSDKKSGDRFEKYASDQRWKVLQEVHTFLAFEKDLVKQRNIWSTTMKYSY
jgi:hypothetical protein